MRKSFLPQSADRSSDVAVKWRAIPSRLWLGVILMLLLTESVTAQDPQFSQFYAAPLYLNPAFAGSTGQARAGINYRNQWPAIDANFTTMSAYFDYFIADKKSAVGALLTRDTEGLGGFRSLNFSLQYSYELQITKNIGFKPGLQVGIVNRDVGFSRLVFGDQIDPNTGDIVRPSSMELADLAGQGSRTFVDLSAGGVIFTRVAWLGFAANHLTTPNQSAIGESAPLPIKYSAHGGFKYFMRPGVVGSGVYSRNAERSIAPAFQYRHQGNFDQLDLGVYFTFEPLVLGTWYRGVPFKSVNGFVNNESLVLLLGFVKLGAKDAINIGYSFDYTISKLGPGSGGAHEFSLVYTWPMRNPRKPDPDKLMIPCPEF